ncbi:hypothetical protein [Streptomyces sp. LaPpAH-108]|uniref:hypothetical protein n=1 Tax=Streptomyces sp. LaPpAH-108 TaxID=1155714 RepID=UPI000377CDD1|nr:hypothetical protein [Streptomyces sp. LaPpAH-108]
MTDQLSLATVATTALPQIFGFLFGRLGEALDRRAESREEEEFRPALAEPPAPYVLRPEALTGERVARLSGAERELDVYRRNPGLIRPEDANLVRTLSQVRDDLEAVYGQRFTFAGERRPAAGVRVVQRVDEVEANAVARGVTARRVTDRAAVDIEQTTRTVRPGGELTGLDVDGTLG